MKIDEISINYEIVNGEKIYMYHVRIQLSADFCDSFGIWVTREEFKKMLSQCKFSRRYKSRVDESIWRVYKPIEK